MRKQSCERPSEMVEEMEEVRGGNQEKLIQATYRSGLRLRDDIPSTNNGPDSPLLDGAGPLKAEGINTAEEGRLEVERIKRRRGGGVVGGFHGPLPAAAAVGLLLALPMVAVPTFVLVPSALLVGGSVAAAAAAAATASMFRHVGLVVPGENEWPRLLRDQV